MTEMHAIFYQDDSPQTFGLAMDASSAEKLFFGYPGIVVLCVSPPLVRYCDSFSDAREFFHYAEQERRKIMGIK